MRHEGQTDGDAAREHRPFEQILLLSHLVEDIDCEKWKGEDREEMKTCVWLKPQLVAQIEFTEWTPDGHLRHAKFAGLREDKESREVVRELA